MLNSLTEQKNILLVDDEKNLTQMLAMLLSTRGYHVDVASSGREALQKITPDINLVILDLILPDLNGFEVCRRLKDETYTKHIPIIMLSAHCVAEDKVEGLYLGADDFLSKPCEHDELVARMEAVMRRNQKVLRTQKERTDALVCELRKILDEGLLIPYFQPIYWFHPFRLLGVEILTRPVSQTALANPEEFFKAALKYGMYADMEILAWSTALPQVAKFLRDEKVFLNCNPYFIETAPFAKVKALFEKNHVAPQNVVLEITERSAIADFKLFYTQLNNYRDYGFRFAVDDVGGGYASLESIIETKPEVLKIDRSIVADLQRDPYKRSIVKFIGQFCRENRILSIAEGIETKSDFEFLSGINLDAGQGYYFCKPTTTLDRQRFENVRQ